MIARVALVWSIFLVLASCTGRPDASPPPGVTSAPTSSAAAAISPSALVTPVPSATLPAATQEPAATTVPPRTAEPAASSFVLTGAVTYAGRPIRAAVNVYLATPDYCAKWLSGAFNQGGSVASQTVGESGFAGLPAGTYRMQLPRAAYVVLVSPRVNPPGGNWFVTSTAPVLADAAGCESALRVALDHDTTLNVSLR